MRFTNHIKNHHWFKAKLRQTGHLGPACNRHLRAHSLWNGPWIHGKNAMLLGPIGIKQIGQSKSRKGWRPGGPATSAATLPGGAGAGPTGPGPPSATAPPSAATAAPGPGPFAATAGPPSAASCATATICCHSSCATATICSCRPIAICSCTSSSSAALIVPFPPLLLLILILALEGVDHGLNNSGHISPWLPGLPFLGTRSFVIAFWIPHPTPPHGCFRGKLALQITLDLQQLNGPRLNGLVQWSVTVDFQVYTNSMCSESGYQLPIFKLLKDHTADCQICLRHDKKTWFSDQNSVMDWPTRRGSQFNAKAPLQAPSTLVLWVLEHPLVLGMLMGSLRIKKSQSRIKTICYYYITF